MKQKQLISIANTMAMETPVNLLPPVQEEEQLDPNSFQNFQDVILQGLSNLGNVLDNWKGGRISKQETMAIIIASTKESIETAERNRLLAVDEMMRNKLNRNDENDEFLFDSHHECVKTVPALTQMGVPVTANAIRCIAKELAILDTEFPEKELLYYQTFNGKDNALLVVPHCTTKGSFVKSNSKSKFIDKLPSMISGDKDNNQLNNEICGWIIQRLGSLHENKLVEVIQKMGYNISGTEMDVFTATAMWQDANVNTKGQRVIIRYLRGTFGKSVRLPNPIWDEKEENAETGKHKDVEPVYGIKKIDGELVTYWTKPLAPCISASVSSRLFSSITGPVDQ